MRDEVWFARVRGPVAPGKEKITDLHGLDFLFLESPDLRCAHRKEHFQAIELEPPD